MNKINIFLKNLENEFTDTCFTHIYDATLDLHQILHNNYKLEESEDNDSKIASLLDEYFFKDGKYNIMVSYDFYKEMDITKQKRK